MLKGLWTLTWIEFKVFMREPMGSITALLIPVFIFLVLGQIPSFAGTELSPNQTRIQIPLPVFAILYIGISNVTSLVTIISIYREGGILKRLRATPLRPYTILTAQVLVKLSITTISLTILMLAGKTFGALHEQVNIVNFFIAVVFSFTSLMSIGFVIASMVPTARFAQPLATFVLLPMIVFSPIFIPMEEFPSSIITTIINLSPFTHVVNLLDSIWAGNGWDDQLTSMLGLSITFIVCLTISTKVFRWE